MMNALDASSPAQSVDLLNVVQNAGMYTYYFK
jgi:hypothetical protein